MLLIHKVICEDWTSLYYQVCAIRGHTGSFCLFKLSNVSFTSHFKSSCVLLVDLIPRYLIVLVVILNGVLFFDTSFNWYVSF